MGPSFARLRFLILDDNAHMITVVKTILRGFEARVMFDAQDAAEAFDHIRHDAIDIVIADYHMELLDGIEFVTLVRTSSDSPNPFIPIIMLTAHTERSRVIAARDAGVTEVCAKPVTALGLFEKVRAVVERPRPFIKSMNFFGPDRRRRSDPSYRGRERRVGGAGLVDATIDDFRALKPPPPPPSQPHIPPSDAGEEDLWTSMA